MSQSLSQVLLHVVFSTKHRQPLLAEDIQPQLHAYLARACRALGSQAYRVGGTDNHVHIACSLPRTLTISKLMEEIKKSSSIWIKDKDENCRNFSWQAGYGAFSLGQSQLPRLLQYIDNQHEHHRKQSFEEELIELLQRYQVDYDERYLWD
jgi:putative transposase